MSEALHQEMMRLYAISADHERRLAFLEQQLEALEKFVEALLERLNEGDALPVIDWQRGSGLEV